MAWPVHPADHFSRGDGKQKYAQVSRNIFGTVESGLMLPPVIGQPIISGCLRVLFQIDFMYSGFIIYSGMKPAEIISRADPIHIFDIQYIIIESLSH